MIRLGIIGVGGIANNAHIPGLQKAGGCEIVAVCDIDPKALAATGDRLHIPPERRFADYHDLLACPEVEAVEICTPNHMHAPIALAAVQAGKPFELEKPLSTDLAHAKDLVDALAQTPVPNMMCFSYRFMPAVRFAKWLLERGKIGRIINVDVAYLKSSAFMEGRRLDWRFVKEYAGTGVLGDLGVHLIDMTRYLLGEFQAVCGHTEIVVKERKKLDSEELAPVETDDLCTFLARLEGNVFANFLITRCAIGNINTIKFDIYGEEGVISFNLNQPDTLGICLGEVGKMTGDLHTVRVPDKFRRTQEETFLHLLQGKRDEDLPTVEDGIAAQKILDALVRSSEEGRFVPLA